MKKVFSLFTSLVMAFSLLGVMPVMGAGTILSGNYEYDVLADGTVEIVAYTGSATDVTIPYELGGKLVTSIGYRAFYDCNKLKNLTIPETVTYIGNYAFYSCDALANLTISKKATVIGSSAFAYCPHLTNVTIPESVTRIEDKAFYNCQSLGSIAIPESVTSIGGDAFYNTPWLKNIRRENPLVVVNGILIDGTWCNGDVIIPDDVTSVGNNAFYGCTGVTSVTIPSGVTSIGYGAFSNCTNLVSVTIPDSVKSIGYQAFYYCENLKNVTIPKGVTNIGYETFYNCDSLTSITIPDGVTKIGKTAFGSCDNLSDLAVGDSVTEIGENAFDGCTSLKYLYIPDSVTTIGNYAYCNCDSITSVTIGSGVTRIGERVFMGCDNLVKVTIPESVTSIGDYAFSYCEKLENVTIPDSVKSIGNYTFSGCSQLKSLTIPRSVTSIGVYAFGDCENLTIRCYANSVAHQYAVENGIKYWLTISEPTGFNIDATSTSSIRVKWNKSSTADGYILEQYKDQKWTRVTKITNPSTVKYSVKGLASGTTYWFRLKAYKMYDGNAIYSGNTCELTACTNPATPKAKMALNSSSSIRLSWNKITGAGGYIVEQYKGGKWVRLTKITSPSTIQYSVKGLASGTTYKFRVRAYKMLSGKAYYSDYSSTVTACTKPATVKFTLTAGSRKATVKWSKVTGASGYIVYYKTSANGSWTRLTKVGASTTSYTKTGLTKGKTYYFTVKPYKTLGGKVYYGGITSKSVKVK